MEVFKNLSDIQHINLGFILKCWSIFQFNLEIHRRSIFFVKSSTQRPFLFSMVWGLFNSDIARKKTMVRFI